MMRARSRAARWLGAGVVFLSLCLTTRAWEPNEADLDAAIAKGSFSDYFGKLTEWLGAKVPAQTNQISEATLTPLVKDKAVLDALTLRTFIAKCGGQNVDAFAAANDGNKAFLKWVLRNTEAMDLCLIGATPNALAWRADNSWGVPVSALNIWKTIYEADPDSKSGLYLRLAIATGLNPPGTSERGAGQPATPPDPLSRYNHFKAAHKNGELFPTFDGLMVWDLRQVVKCNASNEDMAWAREMVNTWRPDLRKKEQVAVTTSSVWRRNSPIPFGESYKNVLSGGGKCGPRSSWAVFINQAWGIPAFGVGQPAHACCAYRAAYPSADPQIGCRWKVIQGRGWAVSRVGDGSSGPDFFAGTNERERRDEFAQVEHLRWLASATAAPAQPAVLNVMRAVQKASGEKAVAEQDKQKDAEFPEPAPKDEPAFEAKPGVIHLEAEAFAKMQGVNVIDCFTGGKQVNFNQGGDGWMEYAVDVPADGKYGLTLRTAAVNVDQVLTVAVLTNVLATVKVPQTHGLWGTTEEMEIPLSKGQQALRVAAPAQRIVAVRWLELKAK